MLQLKRSIDLSSGVPERCQSNWLQIERYDTANSIRIPRARTLIVTDDAHEGLNFAIDPYALSPYYIVETQVPFRGSEHNLRHSTQGIARVALCAAHVKNTGEVAHRVTVELFADESPMGFVAETGVLAEVGNTVDRQTEDSRTVFRATMSAIDKYVNGQL